MTNEIKLGIIESYLRTKPSDVFPTLKLFSDGRGEIFFTAALGNGDHLAGMSFPITNIMMFGLVRDLLNSRGERYEVIWDSVQSYESLAA